MIRNILIRERIQLVHGHAAFSTFAQEATLHARSLGLRVVFTDHSLFGFADLSSILTNRLLHLCMSQANHVICVSHTSKENTVLRAYLDPSKVSVIPNAVDSKKFLPRKTRSNTDDIVIVVMSRLVYRKGTDLLISLIPILCERYENIRFIIGGDGPMRINMEEMRERCNLQDRVEMLGTLAHDKVAEQLRKGDIFVNTSLTEAFCMVRMGSAVLISLEWSFGFWGIQKPLSMIKFIPLPGNRRSRLLWPIRRQHPRRRRSRSPPRPTNSPLRHNRRFADRKMHQRNRKTSQITNPSAVENARSRC